MSTIATQAGSPRTSQPTCLTCHHPISFHGGGETHCRALGCACNTWVTEDSADGVYTMSVEQVAKVLGKGQTWVKSHAQELGGVKVNRRWRFSESGLQRWRRGLPQE